MRRDSWLGIAAVAVLVVALVGVFRYESSSAAGSAFRVTFARSTAPGPPGAGHAVEGASTVVPLRVDTLNLTRVDIVLSWSDDVGEPDTFHLVVTSPTGVTREAEGSDGRLAVTVDAIASVPTDTHVLAASRLDAQARIASSAASTVGSGIWNVTVKLVRAPGVVAPAGGVELQKDGANDWTIATSLTTYSANVENE